MFRAIECFLSSAGAKKHSTGFLGEKKAGMGGFAPNPYNFSQIILLFTKSENLILDIFKVKKDLYLVLFYFYGFLNYFK